MLGSVADTQSRNSDTGLWKWEFMLLDSSVACLCHHGHSVYGLQDEFWVADDKIGQLAKSFCLLSYLVPFSGWAGAFWHTLMCATGIFTLCAYSDLSIHMPLSQNNLSQLPCPFPSRPLPSNLCTFTSQAMSDPLFSALPIEKFSPFYCF